MRDYQGVVARLQALGRRGWQVEPVAEIAGYPVYTVQRSMAGNAPTVLLSGGMHGEEPAGVEGVLRWLEGTRWRSWRLNWFVLPCINPYGWERNQRRNRQRRDINRHFRGRSAVPEAELIKRLVRGRRFLFSMEFHEDVDATGFYLYEARRHGVFIGEQVVQAVSRVVHINRDPVIDGNEATAMGIIRRDLTLAGMRRRKQWPMAYHLYQKCTDNIFGSETPITVPLRQRARAHQVALATLVELVTGERSATG